MPDKEPFQSYVTELRRGSLTLAVLGCLQQPQYGYALLQAMQEKGVDVEANTLYPLLRRLERQDLLNSDWELAENRPRKYYRISEKGKEALQRLQTEWEKMQRSIDTICAGEKGV